MKTKEKMTAKTASDLLLTAAVAIHKLEALGPDYAIWQNAQFSHKTLKQIKNKLNFIR